MTPYRKQQKWPKSAGILISGGFRNLHLSGVKCSDSDDAGLATRVSGRVRIEGCEAYDTDGFGFDIEADDVSISNSKTTRTRKGGFNVVAHSDHRTLFEEVRRHFFESELTISQREELNSLLDKFQRADAPEERRRIYDDIVGSIADHVTLLAAVSPILGAIIA